MARRMTLLRPTRRGWLARSLAALAVAPTAACAAEEAPPPVTAAPTDPFGIWLLNFRTDANSGGVSDEVIDRIFPTLKVNPRVVELDRRQPEFTMTWARYRETRLSDTRIARGREELRSNVTLLRLIEDRFGVPGRVIVSIWGLETSFGGFTGNFSTLDSLATLAYEGRRATYFRRELVAALRIVQQGDKPHERMTGSWAGAMGQPQFMPTSFLKLAVDFDGDGRRDIWDSRPDALASIANYLARSNWSPGEPWIRRVTLPKGFDVTRAGRANRRPSADWTRAGVRRPDGSPLPPEDPPSGILLPDGVSGEAYAVHRNFDVFRAYNPSDYYALAVGLLADAIRS